VNHFNSISPNLCPPLIFGYRPHGSKILTLKNWFVDRSGPITLVHWLDAAKKSWLPGTGHGDQVERFPLDSTTKPRFARRKKLTLTFAPSAETSIFQRPELTRGEVPVRNS